MFHVQVKIDGRWESMRPSGGAPYEYATREEAEDVMRLCYPEQVAGIKGEARVAECCDTCRKPMDDYTAMARCLDKWHPAPWPSQRR